KLRPAERAKAEVDDIARLARDESQQHKISWRKVLANKWFIRILLVGVGLGVFQQLTGINSILYYGQVVLTDAGFSRDAALIANIAPGVISVITAIIALQMMDRFSRRK